MIPHNSSNEQAKNNSKKFLFTNAEQEKTLKLGALRSTLLA
jgi:hypothetical protein